MREVFETILNLSMRVLPQGMRTLALFLWVLLMAGCGASARSDFDLNQGRSTGPNTDEAERIFADQAANLTSGDEWRYRIQGGDQLEVVFFTHPEQNRFVTVRPDGYITLPYLGDIQAEGKAAEVLADQLQDRYSEVLVSPRVDVIVQQMGARYYVLGEVSRPGEFAYARRIDILQALATAGGYEQSARLSNIVLLRKGEDGQKSFAALLDLRDYMAAEDREVSLELRPYDILWVPRSNISRWDNATEQALRGLLLSANVAIQGWSLVNFESVFENRRF